MLEEQEALEALNHTIEEPKDGTSAQHKRDKEAYIVWKKKNSIARITLLSSMEDDIMCEFKKYQMAQKM